MAQPNRISYLRKRRGYSMQKLAHRIGTSQQQIDRLEKGQRRLTVEWMERLSDALDCGIMDLLPENHKERDFTQTKKAKIIGAIDMDSGGKLAEFDEKDIYTIIFGRPANMGASRLFALQVRGEGMGLRNGAEIILSEVERNQEIEGGKIVLCAEKSGQFFLRKSPISEEDGVVKAIVIRVAQDV